MSEKQQFINYWTEMRSQGHELNNWIPSCKFALPWISRILNSFQEKFAREPILQLYLLQCLSLKMCTHLFLQGKITLRNTKLSN